MDNVPPDQLIIVVKQLLGNPFGLAIIISHFLELTDYFQNEANSPKAKLAIVTVACAIGAVVYTALTPAGIDATKQGLLSLFALAIAMVLSTQIGHLLIEKVSPALAALFAPKTTSEISVKTDASGKVEATAKTEQPSKEASAEPTLNAAAQAVNVATPDLVDEDTKVLDAIAFMKAHSLALLPEDKPHIPTINAIVERMQQGGFGASPSFGYTPDRASADMPPAGTPAFADDFTGDAMQRAVAAEMAVQLKDSETTKG